MTSIPGFERFHFRLLLFVPRRRPGHFLFLQTHLESSTPRSDFLHSRLAAPLGIALGSRATLTLQSRHYSDH